MPVLLTISEVATRLALSRQRVHQLIQHTQTPVTRQGHRVLLTEPQYWELISRRAARYARWLKGEK